MVSINEIQARISDHGLTSPNRFIVEFKSPPGLIGLFPPGTQERLAIQCEVVALPGKAFSTQENRIWGPLRKLPYQPTFTSSIDITFRVGTDFKERSIFDEWQRLVMSPDTNMFNYYNEYTTGILIHQLDRADERIYSVELQEAWPETIGSIDLSSAATDTYNRQTISFSYRLWEDVTDKVLPLVISSITTTSKAEGGKVGTFLLRSAGAFFDQLPRITGSGGTIFGSVLNRSF